VSRSSLTIEQILTLLAATPSRITEFSRGLTSTQLHTSSDQNDWSATDVLAHLRACADVWGDCIMTMIVEETPTLRAVDPRTWIKKTDYRELDFQPSLRSFAAQRSDLLSALQPLPHEGWSRSSTVTGAGKVLQRTVLSYAERLARHERQHVKQIERITNGMRGEQRPTPLR